MNHVERFEAMCEEARPDQERLLRREVRKQHMSHELACKVLDWLAEGREVALAADQDTGTVIPLRLVPQGSEELGSSYIDYGTGGDAA